MRDGNRNSHRNKSVDCSFLPQLALQGTWPELVCMRVVTTLSGLTISCVYEPAAQPTSKFAARDRRSSSSTRASAAGLTMTGELALVVVAEVMVVVDRDETEARGVPVWILERAAKDAARDTARAWGVGSTGGGAGSAES